MQSWVTEGTTMYWSHLLCWVQLHTIRFSCMASNTSRLGKTSRIEWWSLCPIPSCLCPSYWSFRRWSLKTNDTKLNPDQWSALIINSTDGVAWLFSCNSILWMNNRIKSQTTIRAMKSPSMQISHALAVGFQTRNYQADQLCLLFLDKLFLLLNFHLQGNLLS